MIAVLVVQLVWLSFIAERCPFEQPLVFEAAMLAEISGEFRCPKILETQRQIDLLPEVGTGWRGLVPLRSKRLDVERLLGQPTASHGRTEVYQTKSEKVEVWFSLGRCGDGQVWNVARDVVLRIVVTPETTVLVRDLNLDGYVRIRENHPQNWIQYWSADGGTMVQAIETDSREEILNVTYQPRKTDLVLRCPSAKRKTAKRFSRLAGWPNFVGLGICTKT